MSFEPQLCASHETLRVIIVVTYTMVMRLLQFKLFYNVGTKILKIFEPDGYKPHDLKIILGQRHLQRCYSSVISSDVLVLYFKC